MELFRAEVSEAGWNNSAETEPGGITPPPTECGFFFVFQK